MTASNGLQKIKSEPQYLAFSLRNMQNDGLLTRNVNGHIGVITIGYEIRRGIITISKEKATQYILKIC